MPPALENPSAHDPALSRDHAAGPYRDRLSPAERALAPEGDVPLQSPNAVADDGVYEGRAGGYAGGDQRAVDGGRAEIDLADTGGAGTYGYPVGPGVGMPGGEHQPADQQPDVLPPQYPER